MLKNYLLQKLGGNCWRNDVMDDNGFRPSNEVFCYDQDIIVAPRDFGKMFHEIPFNKLGRWRDGDGSERSNRLARKFDVLTQCTFVWCRQRQCVTCWASNTWGVIFREPCGNLDGPTRGDHDKIGGTFVEGHGGCGGGAPGAHEWRKPSCHRAWTSVVREMFGGSKIVGLSLGWRGHFVEVRRVVATIVEDHMAHGEIGWHGYRP